MIEIFLIRHGETDWNAARRLQGFHDVPLNARGRRQAQALAHAFGNEPFDAIISSDLARARETAEIMATAQGVQVDIDRGLRERCYGAFEGLLYDDIEQRYPEAFAAWKAREPDARFPPGQSRAETLREFSERAVSTIGRLAGSGRGRKIALVSHGGVLECAHLAARQLPLTQVRDFDIFNASINRFTWDGARLALEQWGDVCHLQDESLLDEMKQ